MTCLVSSFGTLARNNLLGVVDCWLQGTSGAQLPAVFVAQQGGTPRGGGHHTVVVIRPTCRGALQQVFSLGYYLAHVLAHLLAMSCLVYYLVTTRPKFLAHLLAKTCSVSSLDLILSRFELTRHALLLADLPC